MAISDDVVLNLVIKAKLDPAEAQRIAAQGLGPVEAELRASLERQKEAHSNANRVMSEQGRLYAKQEISEAQNRTVQLAAAARVLTGEQAAAAKVAANAEREKVNAAKQADAEIQKMGRAQSAALVENAAREKAALKEADEAQRHHVESMRAGAEIAFVAFEAMKQGWEQFKQFAEQVIKTTQIHEAFTGSIVAARQAVHGEIDDLALISASNRAAEQDLKLTGDQFALVAQSAKRFADAVGINSKEALDQLVQGLAQGRLRTLAHAGVIIDATKAQEEFAKKIGTGVEALTEEEKRLAISNAALEKMEEKKNDIDVLFEKPANLASLMEQSIAKMKNSWDDLLAALGSWSPPEWLTKFFGGSDEAELRKMADPNMRDPRQKWAEEQLRGIDAAKVAKENARLRMDAQAHGEYYEGGGYHGIAGSSPDRGKLEYGTDAPDTSFKGVDPITKMFDKIYNEERVAKEARENDLRDLEELLTDPYKHLDEAVAAAQSRKAVDFSQRQSIFDAAQFGSAAGGAEHVGVPSDINGKEMGPVYRMAGKGTGEDRTKQAEQEFADAEVMLRQKALFEQALNKETYAAKKKEEDEDFAKLQADAARANQMIVAMGGQLEDLAGGKEGRRGIFDKLLFGDEGFEAMYARTKEGAIQLAEIAKSMHDTMSSTGKAMEGAIGHSIAAAIGENKNLKDSLRDTTHAVLMALSEQAFIKSLFFFAEGLGDLAYPATWGLAPAAFEAAAGFAAVGVAAGVGARATYSAPSSGVAAGSTPTQSRSPSSSSSSTGSSDGTGNVTLIINAPLGDKLSVGRAVNDALATYKQVTGREIGVYG